MTLDEAIKHAEEKAGNCECGKEHAQLASWLKELKAARAELQSRGPRWKDGGDAMAGALAGM